jgi:hypothetical protein
MIWPDAGEPGEKYAGEVARIIHGLGCEVSIIDAVALASMAPGGGKREPVKGFDAGRTRLPSGRTSRRFARRLTGSRSHMRRGRNSCLGARSKWTLRASPPK